jgi:hypothetical protein
MIELFAAWGLVNLALPIIGWVFRRSPDVVERRRWDEAQ